MNGLSGNSISRRLSGCQFASMTNLILITRYRQWKESGSGLQPHRTSAKASRLGDTRTRGCSLVGLKQKYLAAVTACQDHAFGKTKLHLSWL